MMRRRMREAGSMQNQTYGQKPLTAAFKEEHAAAVAGTDGSRCLCVRGGKREALSDTAAAAFSAASSSETSAVALSFLNTHVDHKSTPTSPTSPSLQRPSPKPAGSGAVAGVGRTSAAQRDQDYLLPHEEDGPGTPLHPPACRQ